ncbi:hypothetical protein OTK51_18065 [Vibrio scophthalmi]|uniref:hypothetical protein n=1 Tax=Vibrio scophthalmi TaxID=45658 RepID=UPI002284EAD9|nr:hypothetical protein [Vibrio scophthalmi]MCY9805332.1 hypothetical protein [Vibrio scophthalmi]
MTIFREDTIVTVYCWDLVSGIFTTSMEYAAEAGFGLPNGMTLEAPVMVTGKVAIRNVKDGEWFYVDDDRGRERYMKFDGSKYITTKLHEDLNPQYCTEIEPPNVEGDKLVRFNDELQDWQIGFAWYEKPIWNDLKERFIFLGDFFVPNRNQTHIEPPQNSTGYILDDKGLWIKPVMAYHKKTQEEKEFDYAHQVTEEFTQSKPSTLWDEWTNDCWVTNTQQKYIDEYAEVDAVRESLYRQMIDPLEGEAARKARQGKTEDAQMFYDRIDEIEAKIKAENPFPIAS